MRAFAVCLFAAILLAHIMLGCCWHHAHEDSRGTCEGPRCAFVPASPQKANSSVASRLTTVLSAPALLLCPSLADASCLREDLAPLGRGSSLRLHLLHRVLLV